MAATESEGSARICALPPPRSKSERILQRELHQPRRADGLGDLGNVRALFNVGKPKVQRVLE